jgi:TonB family protein
MPHNTQHEERAPGIVESRARPRVKVHSLAYVELGEGNAGLILNISETGMAVQAVQMLSSDRFPRIQFRLPKTDTLIEASGKLIWQIKSKKEVGIEFVGLSDPARAAIGKWIAAERLRQSSAAPVEQSKPLPGPGIQSDDQLKPREEKQGPRFAPLPVSTPVSSSDEPAFTPENGEKQRDLGRPATSRGTGVPFAPGRVVPARWRSDPKTAQGLGADRIAAMPRWNGNMAPSFGMEFKKRRGGGGYIVALVLIAALAFAAYLVLIPGAVTQVRTQIDTLVRMFSTTLSSAQPAVQKDASQATSPSGEASGVAARAPSVAQPPPAAQTPLSSGGGQATSAHQQPSPPAAVPLPESGSAGTEKSSANGASSASSTAPTASGRSDEAPRREQTQKRTAQTAPAGSSRSGSRREPVERYQQPPIRTEQNTYARSTPYTPPASYSSGSSASASPVAVVDIPSYASVPVPPSTPLAGVPSGSVAATSQLRAVRIPASLEWARQYLPGNLGAGQPVSSYSPAYPVEAARKGIEGIVRLDVAVGMDGTVRNVQVISGPAMLAAAAVSAVRDWRYTETFLAGRAVETEQNVTMVFRLASRR